MKYYAHKYKDVYTQKMMGTSTPKLTIKNGIWVEVTEKIYKAMPIPCNLQYKSCEWDGYDTNDDTTAVVSQTNDEPTAAEDIMTMTVDHEYRLTLLELGITEE